MPSDLSKRRRTTVRQCHCGSHCGNQLCPGPSRWHFHFIFLFNFLKCLFWFTIYLCVYVVVHFPSCVSQSQCHNWMNQFYLTTNIALKKVFLTTLCIVLSCMDLPQPFVDYERIDRAINRSIAADLSQWDLKRHVIQLTLTLFVDIIKGVFAADVLLSSHWLLSCTVTFTVTFASSSLYSFFGNEFAQGPTCQLHCTAVALSTHFPKL